jgi:hypothetical protein
MRSKRWRGTERMRFFTQPERGPVDKAGMLTAASLSNREVESIYVTLWLGALMLRADASGDLCPDDLAELATDFLIAFKAVAQA